MVVPNVEALMARAGTEARARALKATLESQKKNEDDEAARVKKAAATAKTKNPEDIEKEKDLAKKLDTVKNELDAAETANKKDHQAKFYIYLWDPSTNTSKMDKFVTIGSIKNIEDATLGDIRKKLISEKAFNWRQKSGEFCNAVGAEVEDSMSFEMYLEYLKETENEGEAEPADKTQTGKNKKAQQPVAKDDNKGKSFKVYMKLRKMATELDKETRDFLKEKLEIELGRTDVLKPETRMLTSSYAHDNFMALTSSSKNITHPADMGEREWYIVFQNNSVLNGSYVRQFSNGQRKVERAMYPALTLKPRLFHDYEIVAGAGRDKIKGKKPTSDADSDDDEYLMHRLRIPRFLVQDDSYVTVTENKTSVADAIADSSLSEYAAEVSVGGAAFGVTAGAKVGFKYDSSVKTATNTQTDQNRMTITYNFPRVVLELDGESLELSDECKTDLEAIQTPKHVERFKKKYGYFFATRVELGGRLHSSQDSAAFSQKSMSERASSMKGAASASFSYGGIAEGSASYSQGKADNNTTSKENSSLKMNMSWEAKGGDTLLCNNPPAWCSTVASYYNWRIVKQDDLVPIEDMLSLIHGYETTAQKFQALAPSAKDAVGNELQTIPENLSALPKSWTGWLTFWLKSATEETFLTVVPDGTDMAGFIIDILGKSPGQVAAAQKDPIYFHGLQMKPSAGNDQMFQAGYGHYEVWEGDKPRLRLRAGGKYVVWSNLTQSYVATTTPAPGTATKSRLRCGATTEGSCYLRFIHAYENRSYIENDDLVRIEVYSADDKLVGKVQNMPPVGSYGTTGDIFRFRYLNPFPN